MRALVPLILFGLIASEARAAPADVDPNAAGAVDDDDDDGDSTLAKKRAKKDKKAAKKQSKKKSKDDKAEDKAEDPKANDANASTSKGGDKAAKAHADERDKAASAEGEAGDKPVNAAGEASNFVDLDGDESPTPVVHSFRGDLLNVKIGTGFAGAQSSPFGARTGYGQVFTEGDWAIGKSGVGVHWDVDLRGGLGAFEQRGGFGGFGLFTEPEFYNANNEPFDPEVQPRVPPPPGNQAGPATGARNAIYRRSKIFVTGRNTDYFRIDRLYLSYDIGQFGIDVGRVRIPEAQQTVLDGTQVRLDFDLFKLGFFGGFRPNPWHQQVVGASSGGFIPVSITGGGAPYEWFQVAWGRREFDTAYTPNGSTTGPYSNDVGSSLLGVGTPWSQLGSIRHPSVGSWAALRFDPVFMDIGVGLDLFGDPWFAVCESQTPEVDCQAQPDPYSNNAAPEIDNGQLYRPVEMELFGATPLGVDRVYVTSSGGVRVFQPLTIAWRGTFDIIGAKPLWLRDLFLDATWRNLGPVNVSASYFKINTWATALSYYRFFRPLENSQSLNAREWGALGQPPIEQPLDGLNNGNLYVVDRDRLRLSISAYVWGSLETYLDLIGERRNDFAYGFNNLDASSLPNQFSGLGDSLSLLGDADAQTQQFLCNQSPRDANGNPVAPSDYALVGSNAQVPAYTDRCKIGATLGIRDAFLANIASFDLHITHMQGYFSANTRASGRLGVTWEDRLYVGLNGAAERNFVHRIFAPICNGAGVCPPDYAPANAAEHGASTWGFVPQALGAYQLGFDGSMRLLAGWFVEGSYFGWIEEVPYQGDYYPNGQGVPQLRDPYQITHSIYLRTLYRFY